MSILERIDMTIRPSVLRFAQGMESKLRRDDAVKPSWVTEDLPVLVDGLMCELHELLTELQRNAWLNQEAVAQKCFDVANYAMMIADRVSGKGQDRGRC